MTLGTKTSEFPKVDFELCVLRGQPRRVITCTSDIGNHLGWLKPTDTQYLSSCF